ncbi:hypothetical protein FI667_g2687, partial [Globisporangium splendens]
MERSRSTLSRHRKRRLLDATQHVSPGTELHAAVALAGATSASDGGGRVYGQDAVNDVIRVLRNTKNSVYHRGTFWCGGFGMYLLANCMRLCLWLSDRVGATRKWPDPRRPCFGNNRNQVNNRYGDATGGRSHGAWKELPALEKRQQKSTKHESNAKQQRKIAWEASGSSEKPLGKYHEGASQKNRTLDVREERAGDNAKLRPSAIASDNAPDPVGQQYQEKGFRITMSLASSISMIHPTTNNLHTSEMDERALSMDSDQDVEETRVEEEPAPHPSSALLHPNHMLEIFKTKQMPLSSPAYFKRHLRDDDEGKPPPANRLEIMEWSEWKQKGLTEESAVFGNVTHSSPSPSAKPPVSGSLAVVASNNQRKGPRHAKAISDAPPKQAHSPAAKQLRQSNSKSEERVENINTPECKQNRLHEILTSPVEPSEQNSTHLRSLTKRVNTSFMVSLGLEIDELRREEMQMRSGMHTFIQAERDQLPLKFLFQLPGGAAYCRRQMRRKEYQRLAAMERLCVAIDYVLRGYLTQALTKWVGTTQLAIWVDRDYAARKIQVQVRRHFGKQCFLHLHDSAPVGSRVLRDIYLAPCRNLQYEIPPRVRGERRQIWKAAELVQSAYRRRRFRVFPARYRVAASTIQAQQRMRAARCHYLALRRRVTVFQAVCIRRLRRLIICAQRQKREYVLSRVLLVQRLIRGFLGQRAARALSKINEGEFNAALVVQRCWYQRNNEWSTFLLLGCLRVKESEEVALEAKVLAYKRNYMARQIGLKLPTTPSAMFGSKYAKKEDGTPLHQFWWLKAVPGRLTRHLRYKRLISALNDARESYFRQANAATRMQALVRGHNDRMVAKRERCARKIQKATREFLLWRRIKRELTRIKVTFARQAATDYIAAGFQKVYSSKMKVYNSAAMQIQRFYRGTRSRNMLTQSIVSHEPQTRMAIRIQSLWRCNAHRRIAKKLIWAQKRRLTNPFREYGSLSGILTAMIRQSPAFFDPHDDLRGMGMPTWLRRLGLDSKYLDLFQKSRLFTSNPDPMDAIAHLWQLEPNSCRMQLEALGIEDEGDLDLMVTNLFAAKTIEETKQLRGALSFAKKQQLELKRKCDLALMNLRTAEKRKKSAERALKEILDEMKDFRNPPHALRKQREKSSQELEDSMKAVSEAQEKYDLHSKKHAETGEELKSRHREFSETQEPKEVSALYSQQSLKLISNMNSIREFYLRKFPGLEARALTFVSALDENRVSMWQLESFFREYTSVSTVKANMQVLTYFHLETDMKKADHTRFARCADILQYGYERMCDLMDIPVEVVALTNLGATVSGADQRPSSWGFINQALLDTICLARKAATVADKAKLWRQGNDSVIQLNKIALGVQSMWRRRAAKKLMSIVRNRRGRERIQAEYIAEYHPGHATPIWEAERKREQEELEEWLDQEAMEARLDVLHQTLRFPYQEEWDGRTQTYYYYCEDITTVDGSNRQYAVDGKPVHTIEEEDATIVIQSAARAFLARLELLALQRDQRRRALEARWNQLREERSRVVTLNFRLQVASNRRIVSWIKERKEIVQRKSQSNNSEDKKQATSGKGNKLEASKAGKEKEHAKSSRDDASTVGLETDAWKVQMNAFIYGQVTSTYNKSMRIENRRDWAFPAHSRPPNAHGQAIIGLLNHYDHLKKRVSPDTRTDVGLRFTKVELRFGWKEVRVASSTRPYYYNTNTGETVWERPEYTFEDEYAAIKMQTIVRMLIAKNIYANTLGSISFVDSVHNTVRKAGKIGWIGFGLEGVSAAVLLSRFGLSKYMKELSKASVDEIATLSEAKTKKLGWTKEEVGLLKLVPVRIERKFPLSSSEISLAPNAKHPFNFLSTERLVTQIVSKSLPNQQGRALGLVKVIRGSTTPISFRQLEMHPREFAGRPDEALSSIGEIASLEYATLEPQEREICQLFLRCVERCIVFAANLKLSKLRRHLSAVLQVAAKLCSPPESAAPAFALASTTPVSKLSDQEREKYMQAAIDRYPNKIVKGLWENDPSKQQSSQPRFSVAQLAYYLREEALERVLLWVRSALICQATFWMHKMRQWHVSTQAFRAYSATQTQCAWRVHCALEVKALLESQQRSDYEQCCDKNTKSFYFVYTPTKEKLLDEPRGHSGAITPICNAERAARRCDECYSPMGDYVDFCLRNSFTASSVGAFRVYDASGAMRTTASAASSGFTAEVTGARPTSASFTTRWRIFVWNARRESRFSCACKGKKASHDLKLIKQSITEAQVYCEQCCARWGDSRCGHCSHALCNVCLSDKHALICPEAELNRKRQKLLGDKVCVECGKAADRLCETCGDRYCSVRWMGNPGCFERFHQKEKRADRTFSGFEAPMMTPEILELEEKVKQKRKKDAEDAEDEAKAVAAAMLALAQEEETRAKGKETEKANVQEKQQQQTATCGHVHGQILLCEEMRHALEVTKQDRLEAAKLLAQIEKGGGKLPSHTTTFLGSTLLGSLLQPKSAADKKEPAAGKVVSKKTKKNRKNSGKPAEVEAVSATA